MQVLAGMAIVVGSLAGGATASATPERQEATPQSVRIHFESTVADVSEKQLTDTALASLNDPRGWGQAGFSFVSDPASPYRVVVAEPAEVDAMCGPLGTGGRVSCQNGNVVALNANRWRSATEDWDQGVEVYRQYLVNHEVGHLIGQFHPANRCPVPGEPEGVMAQQTKGLEGCTGNAWPLDWEIERAKQRPVLMAPGPDVEPAQRAVNPGGGVPATLPPPTATTLPPTVPETPGAGAPATTAEVVAPAPTTSASTATSGEEGLADPELSSSARPRATGEPDSSAVAPAALGILAAVALLGTALALGLRRRNRTTHESGSDWHEPEPEPETQTYSVGPHPAVDPTAAGSARSSVSTPETDALTRGWSIDSSGTAKRFAGGAWMGPGGWSAAEHGLLHRALQRVDRPGATSQNLADELAELFRSQPGLRPKPGEGVAAAVIQDDQALVAVVGELVLTIRRSGADPEVRRQGVVRVRTEGSPSVTLDIRPTSDDGPSDTIRIRHVETVRRHAQQSVRH